MKKSFILKMLVTCFTGLLVNISFAQDSTLIWSPEMMVKLPVVNDPAISPDGDWVAYTVREAKMEGEESKFVSQVWVGKSDGSMNRQYTFGAESASSPTFSPDGQYLTFLSKRKEKQQICRMYLDGGEAEALTDASGDISQFKWSPDGKSIVYTMSDPKTEEEKKNEKEKRDIILVDKNYKYSRLYVFDIETRKSKALYEGDLHTSSFDWSPNGKMIVFSHQPTPKIDDRYELNISMVSADSGQVKSLVEREGVDSDPMFTPDGKSVVFSSHGGRLEGVGLGDLYLVPTTGGVPVRLGLTHDQNVNLVGFNASGELLIQEPRGVNGALYKIVLDGSEPKLLTKEDGVYSRFNINKKGTHVVFTYEDSDIPRNVHVSEVGAIQKNQISDVIVGIELPKSGKTEVVRWKSKDGLEIEGLLTYPVGYRSGDKVPLILMVHGGPAGVYSRSWTGAGGIYAIQYFASKGYALLRPNPRGSTGYGKDFRYANVKDWGFGDYEDLMTGVDHVIEMGVGDANQLFEMGWSYGGFMTSWIVTQTDRFRAVSMGAGLSNIISMVGTTDIPTYIRAHMGGSYREGNMDTYVRHSAVYLLDQVVTPTQIIHGANDKRVPLAQSEEFYWGLKDKNVPTEMIIYPRTPHGPVEPKLQADVSERILTWFEAHKGK